MADDFRPANGKKCLPTEKTYFDQDGVTPLFCAPAGGPAYLFKVYSGKELIWSGELPADKPEVYFVLPGNKPQQPRLVLNRDLEANQAGYTLRFAESKTGKIRQFKSGENVLNIPEMEEVGASIPMEGKNGDVRVHVGKLPGAAVSEADYHLVVRLK